MLTLPEIVRPDGLLTDGDWVESKDQDPAGSIRLTQLADVGDGEFRDRSDRWINEEQARRLNVTQLQPGDVLIARMPDPLGRACLCPQLPTPAVTVVDVCIARAPRHNPKWLMYAINAPQTRVRIASFQSGSTRKRISKKNLSTVPIPLPSREQQDRLVAAIETHFSRLDAAVASLKRAKANVKRARASVLQAAVEGRLVPTEAALARAEGRYYEPAAALLARIVAERKAAWEASGTRGSYKEPVAVATEELPELLEGWRWASMDALTHVVGGLTKDAKRIQGRSVPYLRVANVQRGRLELSEVKTILATEQQIGALRLQPGDILLNEGGDRDKLGRGWIWRGELPECIHQNHVFRARLWMPAFDSRYLSHYANTEGDRYFTREGKQTTNLASISLSKVKALPVALPPSAEIKRILAEVDRHLSVLDALDATIEANLARCARLRQSILERAFSGRLVPAGEPNRRSSREKTFGAHLSWRFPAETNGPATRRLRRRTNREHGRAIICIVIVAAHLRLGDLEFAWDPEKARSNVERHGVSFEEAATTWLDPLAIERRDVAHSADEERWLRIGTSLRGALLVVWSTERGEEQRPVIRIIGARRANRKERELHE